VRQHQSEDAHGDAHEHVLQHAQRGAVEESARGLPAHAAEREEELGAVLPVGPHALLQALVVTQEVVQQPEEAAHRQGRHGEQ